ncbi:MAG: lysozyme, partial [Lachnospiraceae bacterium]|nr:lysozyme [Lachnospiraceae bacterium]
MKNSARKIVSLILACVMMIECVGSQESVSLAKSATYNMATDGSGKCIDGEDHPEDVIYNQKSFRGTTRKATANMVTSDEGVTMIKQFEGLRLEAYKAVSTEAYYTIGYGHYGADVEEDMVITEEEAVELLKEDLKTAEIAVNNMVAVAPEEVTQRQFDALVSFTYNVGTANFEGSSIRAFFVNGLSNYYQDQIIHAIAAYNRSGGVVLKGLTTRRLKEVAYFYNDSTLVDYDLT